MRLNVKLLPTCCCPCCLLLQAVEKRVLALTPELCWHLKGMGVDALDDYPESLSTPSPAGICEQDVGAGCRRAAPGWLRQP